MSILLRVCASYAFPAGWGLPDGHGAIPAGPPGPQRWSQCWRGGVPGVTSQWAALGALLHPQRAGAVTACLVARVCRPWLPPASELGSRPWGARRELGGGPRWFSVPGEPWGGSCRSLGVMWCGVVFKASPAAEWIIGEFSRFPHGWEVAGAPSVWVVSEQVCCCF